VSRRDRELRRDKDLLAPEGAREQGHQGRGAASLRLGLGAEVGPCPPGSGGGGSRFGRRPEQRRRGGGATPPSASRLARGRGAGTRSGGEGASARQGGEGEIFVIY